MPRSYFSFSRAAAYSPLWLLLAIITIAPTIATAASTASNVKSSAASADDLLSGKFQWVASGPLIAPADPKIIAIKDPTVVRHNGLWHIFATVKIPGAQACMEYLNFADWSKAGAAPRHAIKFHERYHCAPQVFYFTPQRKWYLIYQNTDGSRTPPFFGPAVSTTDDISKPETLTPPQMLYPEKPANLKGWLDFWVICDAANAHLFFTSDDGRMWRAQTPLTQFPRGWSQPELVLKGDIFEASHTYRLKGLNQYLTLIEAQGPRQSRYYKAYLADRLDGEWRPLAATADQPFASLKNVRFAPGVEAWTDSISHGELLRENPDETMTVDPDHLKFLFQGCNAQDRDKRGYGQFQWRLGLLEPAQ